MAHNYLLIKISLIIDKIWNNLQKTLFRMRLLFQINNPDKRVEILKAYVQENFPDCPLLKYALQVEKITTSKVI